MKPLLKKFRSTKFLKESAGKSSNHDDTHTAILAFRTVTTMLALIQSPNEIASTGRKEDLLPQQRRQLRVLDALAAVAVRQHEIVAVMSKDYNGFNIEVIASVNDMDPVLNIPQHHDELRGPIRKHRWFISPNPCDPNRKVNKKRKKDSLTTKYSSMTLVNPDGDISKELSEASPDKLLDIFLQTEW